MHRVETEVLPSLGEASYPDPDSFPDSDLEKLTELPNGGRMDEAWLRLHVWKECQSFRIPAEKVMRGRQAVIFVVELCSQGDEPRRLVAKRVVPSELPPKTSRQMWQDFAESAQREVDFYKDLLLQENRPIAELFPRCFFSDANVVEPDSILTDGFYFILMADVGHDFYQEATLTRSQAKALLDTLARFHAHFWNDGGQSCGEKVSEKERGGFWTMERRKSLNEIGDACSTWSSLLSRLPELKDASPNCSELASRLVKRADDLDSFVGSQSHLTRIHGDCKAWNLFLQKSPDNHDEQNVLLIDMQWTGRGHPLQDVAYFLTTSLEVDLLEEMDALVDFYLARLSSYLESKGEPFDAAAVLRPHFDLVWLDYARVIVTGLWKRLSREQIERYRNVVGPSMINKSLPHVVFVIKRLHQKLVVEDVCSLLDSQRQ